MDYVDYNSFMYKTWEKDKTSHMNRITKILKSSSGTLNNKTSEFYYKAPCKHKRDKPNLEIKHENEKHLKALADINKKNISKGLKTQIEKLLSLSVIPNSLKKNNEKIIDSENWKIYQRLCSVKSQFSLED